MSKPVPTPLAAVLGIVPAVLGGVRALPGKAVQLPIFAVSSVLTSLDTARRGYDDLAERGEKLIARLRGTSFDELEDRFEDALSGTVLAPAYEAVEDAVEDVAETVIAFARAPRTSAAQGLEAVADAVEGLAGKAGDVTEGAAGGLAETAVAVADTLGDAAEKITDTAVVASGQAPKGRPTPKATEPDATRVDTAASADVVAVVEQVSAVVGGAVVDHDDLPLPDYDHLTLGALRGRMRSLDLPQLVVLRDYEKAKANRLPVVTMLDNRIAKLANDPTAPLSGGDVGGPSDKAASPRSPAKGDRKGGSKVSPATSADNTATPRAAFGGLGGDVMNKN